MLGASGMRPGPPRSRGVQPQAPRQGPYFLLSLAKGCLVTLWGGPLHPAGPVCLESGDGELTTPHTTPGLPHCHPGAPLQPTIPGAPLPGGWGGPR